MTRSKLNFTLITPLIIIAACLLFGSTGSATKPPAQDSEKLLEIERYPEEPLELVDLKVGANSVKGGIKAKSRNRVNQWGRDSVKFRENDGWFKHVKVKLRNVSGRTIYGLRAGFHFQQPGQRVLYNLPLTWAKNLERDPLQPGDEIDLEVSESVLGVTLRGIKEDGVDVNLTSVSLSVDDAYFSEDLKWSRGALLRRDPNDPNRWDDVNRPAPTAGTSQLKQPLGLKFAKFAPAAYRPQLSQCQAAKGGELGYQCADDYDYCLRIVELGNGSAGVLSTFPVHGQCERSGVSCLKNTTHSRLQYDPSCEPPPPYPCPNTECNEGGNGIPIDYCTYPDTGCPWNYNNTGFCCVPGMSPIIVDVDGAGFHLTSAGDGVWFDFFGTGTAIHISWTAPGSTNAWLALDRNGDGLINNATELFGNITPQPATANPQGFLALAEYDKPARGGNGDGVITKKDGVFSSLLLWQDTSHDGVSQPSELHTLHDLGLKSIDLDYKESKRTDQYGNRFRYRAKVKDTRDAQLGRWAWDVFLVSGQ